MDTASALLATVISSDRAALHNKGSAALYRHTAAAGIAANTSSELTGIAAAAVFQGKGICRDQQDMASFGGRDGLAVQIQGHVFSDRERITEGHTPQ